MKRMFTGLQRRVTSPLQTLNNTSPSAAGNDGPEAVVVREIKAFCESGTGPNNSSNEYVHLPAIVEAAESSAGAAKEAALRIRKYLSSPAHPSTAQYNSIMLIRILSENPGHSFTRNIDAKFVSTIKTLLREGRDLSALHMLRETLDMFEAQKSWDEDLSALLAMWKKEKERAAKFSRSAPPPTEMSSPYQQPYFPRPIPPSGHLPPPAELASRVSEAKTSANLLIQLSQSTPVAEVLSHELMREFSQRCQAASRSIQSYMAVENPPPDEHSMLTLIETNEQLSIALSKYQRAVLNARKALGTATTPAATPPPNSERNSPVNGASNGQAGTASRSDDSASPAVNSSKSATGLPPSLPPVNSTVNESFSSSALPMFDTPADVPNLPQPLQPETRTAASTSTSVSPPAPASRRYQYNADEFNVENPFADTEADDEWPHSGQQKPYSREV